MRFIFALILIAALGACHGARCGDKPWQQTCPIIDDFGPNPRP